MAKITFEEGLCKDNPTTPTVTGCDGAVTIEWIVVAKPAGSQVIFSDDTIPEPEITVTEDGNYTFTVICTFEEGVVIADAPPPPAMNCPLGVVAGQPARIPITGCEDGDLINAVFGGVATGVSFDYDQTAIVTTEVGSTGNASLSVDCILADGTITNFNCSFNVVAADPPLRCTTLISIGYQFIPCGTSCFSSTATAIFDCDAKCETVQFGIVFKDCPECPPKPDCEQLTKIPLVGSSSKAPSPSLTVDCGCEVEEYWDKDRPVLFWRNVCACPGWTLEAPAIDGTTVYNTCSCNPGQKWCFQGTATIVFSGPARFIDSMVIWGHNITDGTVSSSLEISGGTRSVGVTQDDNCTEGYTTPVIINFSDEDPDPLVDSRSSITDFTVTISAADGGVVCIDQLFVGQKLFLPDDALPETFQNPHDGTDYKLEVSNSECGPLSRSLTHVSVPLTLELDCLNLRDRKDKWIPYIRYAQRHGVLFQHSRNNCPGDIFSGWIEGPVAASTYTNANGTKITIQAQGFITQEQPSKFE